MMTINGIILEIATMTIIITLAQETTIITEATIMTENLIRTLLTLVMRHLDIWIHLIMEEDRLDGAIEAQV